MRKLATILLLILFCNSLFYYGYFAISLVKAKIAAKLSLARIDPTADPDILVVAVSRLQKDESNEAWFNNKLYDVADRERINDTVYVFLLRDQEEQELLTGDQRFWQADRGDLSSGDMNMKPVKRTPALIDNELAVGRPLGFLRQPGLNSPLPIAHPSLLLTTSVEKPYPPPKQA